MKLARNQKDENCSQKKMKNGGYFREDTRIKLKLNINLSLKIAPILIFDDASNR